MLRPSFVPPAPIRLLRDLTRYRLDLVDARTAEKQRVEKLLEDAQIKLSVVVSDIFGVSGRADAGALIAGERDPEGAGRAGPGPDARQDPPAGGGVHRALHRAPRVPAATMLARIDEISADIAAVEARIEELIALFAQAVDRLDQIPGVGITAAASSLPARSAWWCARS